MTTAKQPAKGNKPTKPRTATLKCQAHDIALALQQQSITNMIGEMNNHKDFRDETRKSLSDIKLQISEQTTEIKEHVSKEHILPLAERIVKLEKKLYWALGAIAVGTFLIDLYFKIK